MKFLLFFIMTASLFANVDGALAYPEKVDADEISKQVYFVNHQFYVKNQILKSTKKHSLLIVKKQHGKKARAMNADRFLNNDFNDGVTKSKDLVVFNSGKLKGTGVLAREFVDETKSLEIMMWLPALRKVRRMAEPSKNMGYSEADVAFLEEAKLRRLSDDTYELLGTQVRKIEFGQIELEASEMDRYTKALPQEKKTISVEVHALKATPKEDAWYDYRIDYIDTKHFTNYETKFYVADKVVKSVYRQWEKIEELSDERAYMWTYWYSINEETKYETVNYIPKEIIKTNDENIRPSFWSEKTLSNIKR